MSVFFINPFLFEAGADFESIATVTVGSGGASSIEFTSIPGTYQHLQLRMIVRTNRALAIDGLNVTLNADTGSNYAYHILYGDGASALATAGSSAAFMQMFRASANTATSSVFGAFVVDLLDYANTSKNTTLRSFGGSDNNGSGQVALNSGVWMNTAAVTSVKFVGATAADILQHSTAALYGIKAP